MSAVHSGVLWASCSPSRRTGRTSWGAGPPASAPAQWAPGRPREPSGWGRSSPSTWGRTAALLPAATWERGLTLWKNLQAVRWLASPSDALSFCLKHSFNKWICLQPFSNPLMMRSFLLNIHNLTGTVWSAKSPLRGWHVDDWRLN